MSKPDGGPAFPTPYEEDTDVAGAKVRLYVGEGMTLRDKFADSALSGIANELLLIDCMTDQDCELRIINAAALAYRLADAMLAERAKDGS